MRRSLSKPILILVLFSILLCTFAVIVFQMSVPPFPLNAPTYFDSENVKSQFAVVDYYWGRVKSGCKLIKIKHRQKVSGCV